MLLFGGFFVKHAFRLSRVCAALVALSAVAAILLTSGAGAQTVSSSPDTALFQITSTTIPPTPTPSASPTPTPSTTPTPTPTPAPFARNSFAGDISGSGRFVVIESEGDIATDRSSARNNADGNPEIFLFDYAQRRIFQITNTRSALKDTAKSSADATNIDVVIVNLQPVISHDGKYILFQSNAYVDSNPSLTPKSFDGQANAAALKSDGNSEIFIYKLPTYTEVADLSQGTEIAPVDLSTGEMKRVTFTPTTAVPRSAVGTNVPAFFALDNYDPAVNDDGSLVAFVSKARSGNIGGGNADGNKEIFVVKNPFLDARAFTQLTNTTDVPHTNDNPLGRLVWNEAPTISACNGTPPCRVAYISNADTGSDETAANKGNGELFAATLDHASGALQSTRQLTKTPPETRTLIELASVNLLSPGRRITRAGNHVVFESTAVFNGDGTINGALADAAGIYIIDLSSSTTLGFAQVGSRPPTNQFDLPLRWPTFTGDNTRVVWVSNLNYNNDGTVSTTAGTGLNQSNRAQVFSAPIGTLNNVSRVSNLRTASFSSLQPFVSNTIRRMAFSSSTEEGGGNSDSLSEAFYQLIPLATSETPAPSPTPATSPAPVSFFTGASNRAVVAPSPSPTPPDVTGLAPGMLGIARSTLTLAPTTVEVDKNNAHESQRRPPLPVELAGVSVTVSGSAAGLYFAGPNQLNFVVPPGLTATATAVPIIIFNNGALIRTSLQLNTTQPDIFTSTNGAGGRAAVLNVTNPCIAPTGEPFRVTTTRPAGSGATGDCTSTQTETAPTQLLIMLTGVRNISTASNTITVRIGTTDIASTANPDSPIRVSRSNTPGFDQIIVTLPASLAGAGDVPIIVTVSTSTGTFSSRPAETAPRITIQ